ncbi:hypothetical protein SAMN04515692_101410 [Leifsonia sp. CL147]|nr:hypothetical protein SAMN04515694_10169 [Leifsonia sp. CL154]SFL23318.1 hypothetical protein SAMN04515692_101410 [Leifsonia sp. CL147]
MPIRRQAEQMRDLYANEIAAAVADGRQPSALQIASWVRYHDAAIAADPRAVLIQSEGAAEPA